MSAQKEEYTLGVEEEYQIVNPETRGLLARGGHAVQQRAQRALGEEAMPELLTSQIEAISPVCRTLAEVRAEISRLRREVNEAAKEEGGRIAAASTHPFSHWREQRTTPKERYKSVKESYRRLAQEEVVFGFHVHVGLSDREVAVGVMNRLRVWLAPMLALSANSPFWLGDDTGYASYRTQVWGRLPASGPPGHFESRAEHDALVETLVASGVVADPTKIYWDARLPEKVETVEIRVMDVCSRVDEAVMTAGLSRAGARLPRAGRARGDVPEDASGASARRPLARLAGRAGRETLGRGVRACRPGSGDDREAARLHAPGFRGGRGLGGGLDARARDSGAGQRRRPAAPGVRANGTAPRRRRYADRGDGARLLTVLCSINLRYRRDQPPVVREDLGEEVCYLYRESGIFAAEEPVRRVVNRIEKIDPQWVHPMHGGSLPKEVLKRP